MKRKLIQLSPSTAVVSLPSKWIRNNDLKKGSELEVQEAENNIIISTASKKTEKEITIDISGLNSLLFWEYLDSAYIAGYDTITLLTKDRQQLNQMSKVAKSFPGMIVYEERNDRVQFKDITGGQKEDVDKILTRIFHMNVVMLEDGLAAIEKKDWELLEMMKKRDHIVNSYISYCQRQINKYGYTPFSKGNLMHTYLKVMEIISDKISGLFEEIGEKKIKTETEIIKAFLETYQKMQSLHLKYSKEKLVELDETRANLKAIAKATNPKLYPRLIEVINLFFNLEEVEVQLQI